MTSNLPSEELPDEVFADAVAAAAVQLPAEVIANVATAIEAALDVILPHVRAAVSEAARIVSGREASNGK